MGRKQKKKVDKTPAAKGPVGPLDVREPVEGAPQHPTDKYIAKRYRLFSRFDDGVLLDDESWYSVTAEKLADHIAERCRCDTIVDAFAGAGGNSIQFARTCRHVIAVEIDLVRILTGRHNASVYGTSHTIDFIHGDSFETLPFFRGLADVVFLSPPWGGPGYIRHDEFPLDLMEPYTAEQVLNMALSVTPNVVFLLPRNVSDEQIEKLLSSTEPMMTRCEVERNFLGGKLHTITLYFGALVGIEF